MEVFFNQTLEIEMTSNKFDLILKGVTRLAENIYFIKAPGKMLFPFCNGFLFTGKETVLIDAGIGEAMIKEIDRVKRIDILIISHSHPDHIISWHTFRDRHIILPKETPDSITDLQLLGQRFIGTKENGVIWAKFFEDNLGLQPMREPDQRLSDGDLLNIGEFQIQAIHAPGHSVDHYCFLEQNSGTLFTTDIDFTRAGPQYFTPEGDIKRFKDSVKKIMALAYNRVCSSHILPIEGNVDQQFKAFLDAFDHQKNEILALCSQSRTLDEIATTSPFFRNTYKDNDISSTLFKIAESFMIKKNLDLLIQEGLVEISKERYRRVDV